MSFQQEVKEIIDEFNQLRIGLMSGNTGTHVKYRLKTRAIRYLGHLLMLFALLIIVFPLYWMFSSATRPAQELFQRSKPIFNAEFTFVHFNHILFESTTNVVGFYKNSLIIAFGVVLIATMAATLGGYGLSRLDIPYKRVFARGILFGYMFPAILLSIPMFIYWRELGLVNTYIGVILAEAAGALPFGLWLMWKFFETVPKSMEESAYTAGASRFRAFFEIALPMAKPGIIAVAIFAYASSWDQYTIPKVILSDSELWPLTVGIYTFTQQYDVLWGQLMAASALTVIPAFFFVFFLQKHMLRGYRL